MKEIQSKRLPDPVTCPMCGGHLSGITQVSGPGRAMRLTDNPVLCTQCGAFLVFTDEEGRLREMTPAEQATEAFAPSVALMKRIWEEWCAFQNVRRSLSN